MVCNRFQKGENMSLGQLLAAELEREAVSTRKMLERTPADFDWSPHEKSTTLGGLAIHIARLPSYVKPALSETDLNLAAASTDQTILTNGAELAAFFDESVREAVSHLNQISDDELKQNLRLTNGDHVIAETARIGIIRNLVFSHLLHHRGQFSVYLRLKNVPVPSIYGPSADERM